MDEFDPISGSSTRDPDRPNPGRAPIDSYAELTLMIERLHRRYQDVIRIELEAIGISDINAAQALMMLSLRDDEVPVRDILQRGYFQGSSASYNIRKLVDCGYLDQERSAHDRRSVRLRLSDKGRSVVEALRDQEERHAETLLDDPRNEASMDEVKRLMRRLERIWADFIDFGY